MKTGSNITDFGNLISQKTKNLIDIQTHWCTAKSVDWDKKTMTATGVADDLDFYDVLLGLGSINRKPVIGKKCLIGIVNNNAAASFLIECEEVEEFELTDKTGFKLHLNNGSLTINGDQFGGIVKADEIKEQVDKNTLILEKIQSVFNSWIPVPNDGGASLKVLVAEFISLERANLENIKNDKIKHG